MTDLDQWYSDFAETDWRYVERYDQTDRIPERHTCVTTGCTLIERPPIPTLEHREVQVRFAS